MTEIRSAAQEASEDIFFGQLVIIWARWFVIAIGGVAILWTATSTTDLTVAVLLFVPLVAVNFFVHGRYMMEKPINQNLLLTLSIVDVLVITLIVLFWHGPNNYWSPYYIFYYPILLAFAFVFPLKYSVPYVISTLIIYTVICVFGETDLINDAAQIEGLIIRLITLGAVGFLAGFYWRIQRGRRRLASGTRKVSPTASSIAS